MRRTISLLPLVVAAGWFGCSADRDGIEGANVFDVPDGGDGCAVDELTCSPDLRSVIACDGRVIRTCPDDRACGNGECIEPCSAYAMSEGSVGCSFAIPPPVGDVLETAGSCYAFFVANNSTSPANLRVEAGGEEGSLADSVFIPSIEDGAVKHTKLEGPIPPGSGAVVFLSSEKKSDFAVFRTPCPLGTKSIFDGEGPIHETGMGRAALVTSDAPVSMYAIYPYGGARSLFPSAMLLFPTTSYGTNYILTSTWGGDNDRFGTGVLPGADRSVVQEGKPSIQIVAIEDGTSVDVRPKVDIIGGPGVAPSARDEVVRYSLKRGEMVQIAQVNELVGSAIESSKPVGVFGGNTVMNVPADVTYADIENIQIPPVSAWGHEYAVVPAPNRVELVSRGAEKARDPSVVRLVGATDGTELAYEPARPKSFERRRAH